MASVEKINEAFKLFLLKELPHSLKDYKVAIYKKDEKPHEEINSPADINNPLIQNLVICYYKSLFNTMDKFYFTQLWGFVKQLAVRLNDDYEVARLNEIYHNPSDLGFPLPIIEKVVFWNSIVQTSLNKTFNYGYKQKPLKFHEILLAVQESKIEICDIFQGLCAKYDVEISLSLNDLSTGEILKPL